MNILILSAGTRNKIVQYFKKNLHVQSKLVAADCSKIAPALYEADCYEIIPRIDDENYMDSVITILKKHNIDKVISLLDPELSILAKNRDKIESTGAELILSPKETIDVCFDKALFAEHLYQHNIQTVKTYNSFSQFQEAYKNKEIDFPVFVKPRCGSASIGINKVNDMNTLSLILSNNGNFIIQEFCDGIEYGVDAYFDKNHELIDIFIKEKIKMRAGETDKSVSLHDDAIVNLIKKLSQILHFNGPIDVDIFKVNDEIKISEVNPRFGGGYPHAYECGVNFMNKIINEKNRQFSLYKDELYMAKYNELFILDLNKGDIS